jgi:rhodanese-related sulfurtransferase
MWRFTSFISNTIARAMEIAGCGPLVLPISASSLASLSDRTGEGLILLDVRDGHEIEDHSYSIPGALLTANVNLFALVRWIPRDSTVVLFATETIPAHDGRLRLPAKKLKVYALEGGLKSWRKAGLPLEPITLSDHRRVDNR